MFLSFSPSRAVRKFQETTKQIKGQICLSLYIQGVLEEFANEEAEKIYVGKRGGRASITQEGISEILVEQCLKVLPAPLHNGCFDTYLYCASFAVSEGIR